MLLQIKIIYGKNSHSSTGDAEIHSTDPVPKITISEATKRHYTTPNNYSQTVQTMVMMNDVKLRKELQVLQILCYKDQI